MLKLNKTDSRCNDLLEIVYDIYYTITCPPHWQAVFKKLSCYIPNSKCAITRRKNNENGHIDTETFMSAKTFRISKVYIDSYADWGMLIDIWTPIEASFNVGDLCIFSERLPLEELIKTEYYQKWLKPQGINDGISIQLYKNDEYRIVLNVFYNSKIGQEKELHELLRMITPHLCHSVSLWVTLLNNEKFCYSLIDTTYFRNRYGLSKRQAEIANLCVRIGSNKEIAEKLFISENTVKSHFKEIIRKMKVTSRQEVALIASGFIGF